MQGRDVGVEGDREGRVFKKLGIDSLWFSNCLREWINKEFGRLSKGGRGKVKGAGKGSVLVFF